MSGSNSRLQAISAVTSFRPTTPALNFRQVPASELFGANVFNRQVMKERLPKAVYKSLIQTIETGALLDASTADAVAETMKNWAMEKGATHYAHVFFPLTGLTAEKHDSFLSPDGQGGALTEFSSKQLIQGEPDASSFPSGGIRSTFEARGYTAWDVTSPAYILENPNGATLCIPTAFVSWTGEALDNKTPLLRSMQVLDKHARRILNLFGHKEVGYISSTTGAEQEYFLIDRNFYYARPDLLTAGRTLFGAKPPKGQEFEDQYFGVIPERVLAFMLDSEQELYKLGIPIKTRHNEVAPSQYEIAPVYENSNLAADHQQLTMVALRRVAEKYGMACIFSEKPFAGVNGSGKHLNFSLGNSTQGNLLDPGDTPHDNAQFLVFCAAIIRAVSRHSKLLRAVVASAGNDHRLGANEAPPAIISIFLGDQLTDVFAQISKGQARSSKAKGILHVGVDTLPPLPKDAGDRNRTSPLAFTGNKFEFRAVGSNQAIGGASMVLNTIISESLDYFATELEKAGKANLNQTIAKLLQEVIREHGSIIFNGNGYSSAWQEEAEKRGLANLKNSVEALPHLSSPETIALFEEYKILNKRELDSRLEIALEQYCKVLTVEAALTIEIAKTIIYPAAVRYQLELAGAVNQIKAAGCEPEREVLNKISELVLEFVPAIHALEKCAADHSFGSDTYKHACHLSQQLVPAMQRVRHIADELESIVADDHWPLPTYQEMLFVK